jgi:dTDP-L-rhamnose 4-epimerase
VARTLLITGGAGFIGSAIMREALDSGWHVRILDSLREDVHARNWQPPADQPLNIEFLRGDVTVAADLTRALDGVDAVCHEAAKVGLGVNFDDTPDYVHSNDYGTAMLLTAMAQHDIKALALASSMVVYGEGAYRSSRGPVAAPPRSVVDLEFGRFEPVDPKTGEALVPLLVHEDASLDPRNVYAATKAQQEYLATIWARQTGASTALLRYHNVYGPGMPQNTPYAGVASLFRSQLERGEDPTVLEDGGQRRDFVHVRDVARANLAALAWSLEQPAGSVRAFNVGSGEVHTIGELATALASQYRGRTPRVTGGYRMGDVRHITASSERLQTELDVHPSISFEAGMAEFAHAPLRAAAGA